MSVSVTDIAQQVESGRALLEHEARALGTSPDLVSLGMLADRVRFRLHGDAVTYVRVLEVSEGDAMGEAPPAHVGEVRLVGVPSSVNEAVARVRRAREWAGATRVTAFDLADLLTGEASLESWRALAALGEIHLAQASIDRLADPVTSIRAAVGLGFTVPRLTVSRGAADPIDMALMANRVGALDLGVRVFAPLPLHVTAVEPTTGYADSKRVALARLVCDRIPSIQVDWRVYGPKLAQVALFFGADDLDRVAVDETSALGPRRTPIEELRRNIAAASRRGLERNAHFEVVA